MFVVVCLLGLIVNSVDILALYAYLPFIGGFVGLLFCGLLLFGLSGYIVS